MRPRVLFQGSHATRRGDTAEQLELAIPIAKAIGDALVHRGFDLVLTGSLSLDAEVGRAASAACEALGLDPRERLRTYAYGRGAEAQQGFGMVLHPSDRRSQEVRTFVVHESDAVVALLGGKGTSDCIQKAVLARKPVFPIPRAGGAGQAEWERLRGAKYCNVERGDLDFLADRTLQPRELASSIADQIGRLVASRSPSFSRRVFLVHGHDSAAKNELARLLDRLDFAPVILAEQPEKGQELLSKLRTQLADVGYAFVLITPDDQGASMQDPGAKKPRARQNVVFEHGLLFGLLGAERVCANIKGEVELPSDIQGVVMKTIAAQQGIDSIALELVKELRAAGYHVDANRLLDQPMT
jgi:predicted nucleotide-binding protein